jgi:hypothetical protein
MSAAVKGIMVVLALVLVFWNPRGILNKEVEIKELLTEQGAAYLGVAESLTYKDGKAMSDGRWRWDAGPEGKPSERGGCPAGGVGALVDKSRTEATQIFTGDYTVWHRLEVADGAKPLVVGTGYFPQAQDLVGQRAANKELTECLARFRADGYRIVFGGDLNAHTGANFDSTPVDAAGRMLLETVEFADMVMVNTLPGRCTGGPTRVQVRVDGTQKSTIDYIMCTPDLAPLITSMVIMENQRSSDHRPMVLTLAGCTIKAPPPASKLREVWRTDAIPEATDDPSWVNGCQQHFSKWLEHTRTFLESAQRAGTDVAHLGDVLDWSFQHALDEVADEHLGTKWVGPKATTVLDAASRMAIQHRELCQDVLSWSMQDPATSEVDKRAARTQFLAASRAVTSVAKQRRQLTELQLFRDVEANQGDSRKFWNKFREVRNSIVVNKTPPPVATDANGDTITEPTAVLRAWLDFSASIASKDLTDTQEEGRYDDEYRDEVEERLQWLRRVRAHQPNLDRVITREEVFRAIRRLRMGSAPGEDGLLADILKSAANAVGTNKLDDTNAVVDALTLLFNFIFEHEVWPERWSTGTIVPLHKHDSRLDPANYRPITLMAVVGKLFGTVINTRLQNFSESTGSISDEQGGFRRGRGTNDQVFILREVLASRKERGRATYATYIDARKAYDTVWREQAYVRIHDAGVRGKLWRQLQAMHSNLSRRVRHPLGLTDSFPVERGVAQGAVESPWIYSSFIDGLAAELKAAGLGVWIAGVQIPLLMYADDVVMLAASQLELARMNEIATRFAHRNRFEFNGDKSGVMHFNAGPLERARCEATEWTLFGEKVKVKPAYVYLGTITPGNGLSWSDHVAAAITSAKRRSADLLWVCRTDKGMRPRTAVTLWQAMVRPILEFSAELWAGQVTVELERQVERVQTTFLRGTLGLHKNGSGVADDAIRAETGAERLADRRAKLQIGYWRRLFKADPDRLVHKVAIFRWTERTRAAVGSPLGKRGWMPTVEQTLTNAGLGQHWRTPAAATRSASDAWKRESHAAVDAASNTAREARMRGLTSTATYTKIKDWGTNPKVYSFSTGEEGRLGQHVPERYLDDRADLKGTRLKLLCRLGCLPTMHRVGREVKPPWPKVTRTCLVCNTARIEDVAHFVLDCPAYACHRTRLLTDVTGALNRSPTATVSAARFQALPRVCRLALLLGQRFGDPIAENRIDRACKRYIKKAWNARADVTVAINSVLGTKYDVGNALPDSQDIS